MLENHSVKQQRQTVQSRMLAILRDGLPHTRQELHACLYDDCGAMSNIRCHLTLLRRVLRPKGRDILIEWINRRMHYRLVKLIRTRQN